MKDLKSKLVALIGGAGALCVLCCTLPVLGIFGLGSIEAFFCENEMLKGMGITLAGGALVFFAVKIFKRLQPKSCAINCGCNAG